MNKYYVEITRKNGGACVFSANIPAPLAVCAKSKAWEMAEIGKDDRYMYNMYIEIVH